MDENLNFDVKVKVSEIKKALNIPFYFLKKENKKKLKKKKKRVENDRNND